MKRRIIVALTGVALLALAACGTAAASGSGAASSAMQAGSDTASSVVTSESAEISDSIEALENDPESISPDGARALFNSGKAYQLIDVRRADEYEAGHIPGAVNIPNEAIAGERPEELPDLDATVVVYCRTGRRSEEAAEKLSQMGYTDIRDLGGIVDWPYDTISGTEPGNWAVDDTVPMGILSSFTTTDLDGEVVDMSVLADYDLTMVNVWATYCGPCLREMPALGELASDYEDKKVQIIGLVSDVLNFDGSLSEGQLKTARDIVEATDADYHHIVPSQDLYGILSQVTSVPTTFFVDKNGNQVGSVYIGAKEKEAWADIIDKTLAEISQ